MQLRILLGFAGIRTKRPPIPVIKLADFTIIEMECVERPSRWIFYPFQDKHQILGHLQIVKMLCPLKNIKIVEVMKQARLTS